MSQTKEATILFIEDNPHDVMVMQKAFADITSPVCNVVVAEHGQAAMKLLEQGLNPDIILCDIHMPVMSGIDFVQTIKKTLMYRHIPVIMISGMAVPQDAIISYRYNANAFIIKPSDAAELKDMVHHIVGFWLRYCFCPSPL
jgi:chemotaxis family two-component system response regulator Rcp1